MRRFDERWRECVRQARTAAEPPGDGPLPSSAALLRRMRQARVRDAAENVEATDWWRWYGARGLAAATLVLAACLLFAFRGPRREPSLRPGVENAVAEVLWSL